MAVPPDALEVQPLIFNLMQTVKTQPGKRVFKFQHTLSLLHVTLAPT